MKKVILLILGIFAASPMFAQHDADSLSQKFVFPQEVSPQGMDNYLFSIYYYNGKKTYNLRNSVLSRGGIVTGMKMNPSGSSFAIIQAKGKNKEIAIYDLWKANKIKYKIKEVPNPVAICYSPDAKTLAVSDVNNEVWLFNANTYEMQQKLTLPFTATQMSISGNNYFLAASNGQQLDIMNLETQEVRKHIEAADSINCFTFSADDNQLAVLTADGLLSTYDTNNFFILQTYEAMGESRYCSYHPDGKYIAVVTGANRISIINLLDQTDREYIDNPEGGIADARFVKNEKGEIFLAYNTLNSITYELMNKLLPNYTKLLSDELNERMNTWMKMMPGETLEEYNQRVNDETRAQQMRLFEQEIATRMAENLVERSEVTLGNYNPTSNMLAIDFNTMPTIYLNIPMEDITDFMDSGNLEFRNAVYGLTKEDKFELIYADVYNKASGKTYTYDNLARESFDYMKSDDNFLPLELVQQSSMEEIKLQEIKDNIVNTAKQQNLISDHTRITVNADMASDTDANGKKIINYDISFSYEVEEGFSAQEDFGAGKFLINESGAAISMLEIIQAAFEKDFAQYIRTGKKLKVKITGMADASPIRGKIPYGGQYGEYTDEPVYKDGNLSNLTITRQSGITDNEQLAFLRAAGVRDHIQKNIPAITQMDTDYTFYIQVTKEEGSEFRRINVVFTFVDAF